MKPEPNALYYLNDPRRNKSSAFTKEEREEFGLRGLLPYSISSQELQVKRLMEGLNRKTLDIDKYIFLASLQARNERLHYRLIMEHIEEILPLIYTPTVGQACKEFSHIFRRTRGLYVTPEDRGQIARILDNWPEDDVRVIVITDGQRILGLGDLGANGMGIPIGKLSIYIAGAGIPPSQCLPVMFDVGTNNEEILNDILYMGYPQKRLEGEDYFSLMEEFVEAIQEKYPYALIQFEDFLTPNAYALLNNYKDRVLCFNDDIQGTAAVALAGVYASSRITGIDYADLKIMFLGAGSAATGIADLMCSAFSEAGLSETEARKRLWFVDINGLVVTGRDDLMEHNLPYAHDHPQMGFLEAIRSVQPNVLIGATGAPGTFTEEVVREMAKINERPVIFALSNPTSRAECTAAQAYKWSDGRVVYSSGSPFDPVEYNGQTFHPGQGNNAYVFPGIGLGAVVSKAQNLPVEVFLAAAQRLSELVTEEEIKVRKLYPKLSDLRHLSKEIGISVAEKIFDMGLAQIERPEDIARVISDYMYDPRY